MRFRSLPITLAAALAAVLSVTAAQAGANNINLNPGLGSTRPTPSIPDVRVRPLTVDANIRLNCYHTRERNELGVWVHRTRCH